LFALIIGIIAIVLTIALVLAGLFYGGNGFSDNSAKAQAAALQNNGNQIAGAVALYEARHEGATPPSVSALVPRYLTSVPPGSWTFSGNYVQQPGVSETTCEQADAAEGISTIPSCTDAGPGVPCCSE